MGSEMCIRDSIWINCCKSKKKKAIKSKEKIVKLLDRFFKEIILNTTRNGMISKVFIKNNLALNLCILMIESVPFWIIFLSAKNAGKNNKLKNAGYVKELIE